MTAVYQRIVVAVDESANAKAAIQHAIAFAQQFNAEVTLMSVIAVDPFVGVDFYQIAPAITEYFLQAEQSAVQQLASIQQQLQQLDIKVNSKIIHGVTPTIGILQIADEMNADLIIMGSHGRQGLEKVLLGSVAQNVLTQSPIPVLVVKI